MQAIALRPKRSQIISQLIALGVLILLMLFSPALCLPLTLLMPLFVCPVVGLRYQWAAYAAALAPAVVSLASGYDAAYSLSLVAPVGLCVAVAALQRHTHTDAKNEAFTGYLLAYLISLGAIVLLGARAVGGNLTEGLSAALAGAVGSSENPGMTLYRLAAAGLVGVPRSYQNARAISFALDPVLISQLLLSLKLTLRLALTALIPKLFVEACILGGLFTSLRVQRLNHSFLLVKTRDGQKPEPDKDGALIAQPVGFSAFALPQWARWPMALIALGALLLPLVDVPVLRMVGLLCDATFDCVFQLIGAAVLITVFSARKPELRTVFGILAALAYLVLPTALALVGLLDLMLHFRDRSSTNHQEEE